MNRNNIDYLRRHIHHWHTLRDAGYIQNVSSETAEELLRIAQEEFDARYLICLRHPQNVFELIKYVYSQAAGALESDGTETEEVVITATSADVKGSAEKQTGIQRTGKVKQQQNSTKPGNKRAAGLGANVLKSAEQKAPLFGGRPPPGGKVCSL